MIDQKIKNQEHIEAYLRNELNAADRAAFEFKMNNDLALSQEVEIHRLMEQSLSQTSDELEFAALVKKVVDDSAAGPNAKQAAAIDSALTNRKPEAIITRPNWTRWAAAAAVIFILGAAFLWWRGSDVATDLYASHYEPYPAYAVSRSDDHIPKLQEAMEYYSTKQFSEAASIFADLSEDYNDQPPLPFYAGISFLEIKDWRTSLDYFDRVGEQTLYFDQALWYGALASIQINDDASAKKKLNILKDKPGKLGRQAAELLSAIE